jgi:hypothetical protein
LADKTFPIKTSCTWSALIPARSTAALIAAAPKVLAERLESEPPKLPMGVLTAEIIYTSFMFIFNWFAGASYKIKIIRNQHMLVDLMTLFLLISFESI